MNSIETLFERNPDPKNFADAYLRHLTTTLERIDRTEVANLIQTFQNARKAGAKIFFIGNGGSAATASHFANDLGVGTRAWDRPFRAIALTDNVAVITALANDHGYEHIFTLQLKTLLSPGDVVVAISASGNSPNVVQAVQYANTMGATTVGLTGFDGGALRKAVKVPVHVQTGPGEYGPVEDVHMILDHLCGAFLMNWVRGAGKTD
jgi:D-sedoheptulose 7-phosphate isomerase